MMLKSRDFLSLSNFNAGVNHCKNSAGIQAKRTKFCYINNPNSVTSFSDSDKSKSIINDFQTETVLHQHIIMGFRDIDTKSAKQKPHP
jgi:hypothetical protein